MHTYIHTYISLLERLCGSALPISSACYVFLKYSLLFIQR